MNLKKIAIIISFIGILALAFLNQTSTETLKGEIKSIERHNEAIKIILTNNQESIIFSKEFLNVKIGDLILIEGKNKTYQNKNQFIANKIFVKNK